MDALKQAFPNATQFNPNENSGTIGIRDNDGK